MSKPICSKCMFYEWFEDLNESLHIGCCCRYPPVLIDKKNDGDPEGWATPTVYSSAWCGEFQPVEADTIEQLSKGKR